MDLAKDKVNGKGKKIIQDAGIEAISGVLENECIEPIKKDFFTYHEKQRPLHCSKMGRIRRRAPWTKTSTLPQTRQTSLSHQLRADEHAILVGTQ